MNTFRIVIFGTFIFTSCAPKESESLNYKSDVLKFSISDSLIKYENEDSIAISFKHLQTYLDEDTASKLDNEGNYALKEVVDTVNALLFIGQTPQKKFAIVCKSSKAFIYQKNTDGYKLTDSTDFFDPPVFINKMDLNGDGLADLRLGKTLNEETGDLLTSVFLFKSNESMFRPADSFAQNNVEYDPAKKIVRSWLAGTEGQCSVKWRSVIADDRLTVDSTISYCINSNSADLATISIYLKGNSASNPPLNIIEGNADSLWTVFSRTFWDSSKKLNKKRS